MMEFVEMAREREQSKEEEKSAADAARSVARDAKS
jgi:hypothetical protein